MKVLSFAFIFVLSLTFILNVCGRVCAIKNDFHFTIIMNTL